jgi:hypothetical protein
MAEGYTHADVSVVDYDEPTHLARMIAANRDIGEDILSGIGEVLAELDTGAMDMDLTGFDTAAIEELMTGFHVPEENTPIDEGEMADTKNECPKCGFTW